jgi:hypothetical protein
MSYLEGLKVNKGDLFKASVAYCKTRGWKREDWYTAWQTTDLPKEVEEAVKTYYQDSQECKKP